MHTDESAATALVAPRLGGRLGAHVRRGGVWFNPAGWVLATATLTWLLLVVRQQPCRQQVPGEPVNAYYRLCYSDLPLTFQARDYGLGGPILSRGDESPIYLALLAFARRIAYVVGADIGARTSAQQQLDAAYITMAVLSVVLFLAFLTLVIVHLRVRADDPDRGWDALMIAASPAVLAAGLISIDLVAAALLSLALLFWARRQPALAGLVLGLAVTTRLYPLLALVAIGVVCLRRRRLEPWLTLVATTLGTWLAANTWYLVLRRDAWAAHLWQAINRDSAGYGSIWYVLKLSGVTVPLLSLVVSALTVMVIGTVILIGLQTPREPRVGQVLFVLVALVVSVNSVYSPQHVLWLLPLLVLARPAWLDWAVFSVGEVIYFLAIWGHLAGTVGPGVYRAAVVVRLLALGFVVARVLRDMRSPRHDPVRTPGVDDPLAGLAVRPPAGAAPNRRAP